MSEYRLNKIAIALFGAVVFVVISWRYILDLSEHNKLAVGPTSSLVLLVIIACIFALCAVGSRLIWIVSFLFVILHVIPITVGSIIPFVIAEIIVVSYSIIGMAIILLCNNCRFIYLFVSTIIGAAVFYTAFCIFNLIFGNAPGNFGLIVALVAIASVKIALLDRDRIFQSAGACWKRLQFPADAHHAACYLLLLAAMLVGIIHFSAPYDCADCNWYMRRADSLLPFGSFYGPLPFQHFVYYYPKFWDVITLPAVMDESGSGRRAFNFLMNIWMLAGVFLLMLRLSKNFWLAFVLVTAIFFVPVMQWAINVNKPDAFASLCVLSAYLLLVLMIRLRHRRADLVLIFSLSAILLAAAGSSRLSVSYGALIIALASAIAFVVCTFLNRMEKGDVKLTAMQKIMPAGLMALSVAVVTLTLYRTYAATGVPVVLLNTGMNRLPHLTNAFIDGSNSFDISLTFSQFIDTAANMFFEPSKLVRHFDRNLSPLPLVALVFSMMFVPWQIYNQKVANAIGFSIAILVYCVYSYLLAFGAPNVGGDGNYYLVPTLVGVAALCLIPTSAQPVILGAVLASCLVSIVWLGTAHGKLSLSRSVAKATAWYSFDGYFKIYKHYRDGIVKRAHAEQLFSELRRMRRAGDCFGYFYTSEVRETPEFFLPCTIEEITSQGEFDLLWQNIDSGPLSKVSFFIFDSAVFEQVSQRFEQASEWRVQQADPYYIVKR